MFVGYGVSAPERGWDDYKDIDLRGKVAVYLVNDPDFEAAPGDDAYGKFGGKAATYYARWTYKYEEAARRGAIAALIVHETEPAAYGWNTAIAPNGEGYDIVRADPAKEKLLLQSWLHRDAAVEMSARRGPRFRRAEAERTQQGIPPRRTARARRSRRTSRSLTPASTATTCSARSRAGAYHDESIMVGGHWDAYGSGEPDANGLRFRAGALDDAIGMAGAIEIARAFKQGPRPDRTIVFSAWTAEERGLLGSEYYADHPWLPLETTVANFTMDVLQPNGLARDIVLVGAGTERTRFTAGAESRRPGPRRHAGRETRARPRLPCRSLPVRQARRAHVAADGHGRRTRPRQRRARSR